LSWVVGSTFVAERPIAHQFDRSSIAEHSLGLHLSLGMTVLVASASSVPFNDTPETYT
jgi:hypothetical protein